MSAVLNDLVNEKGSFKWKDEHQQVFDASKKSLRKETMLRYFEKQKCLDVWRPIYFANSRLTDVYSRWGKTELETRAVKWEAAEKFGEFLVGTPTFQIFADAKSLLLLFNKASRKPPPRIEIEILGMQHLDFTLVYSPGKQSS